jgi:hypothetical protein
MVFPKTSDRHNKFPRQDGDAYAADGLVLPTKSAWAEKAETRRVRPRPVRTGCRFPRGPDGKRGTSEGLGTKRGTRVRFLQQLTGA